MSQNVDLLYFWSSLFMIVLPITIFSVLTYFVVKAYRKREREAGSTEQKPS